MGLGLGLRVKGLGLRVKGLGFGFRALDKSSSTVGLSGSKNLGSGAMTLLSKPLWRRRGSVPRLSL